MRNDCVQVLFVDDDEDDYVITRDMFAEIEGQAYELNWVTNCAAALAALAEKTFDVCLVDYRLGDNTGLDLLQEAAGHDLATPFILLTGQSDREVDEQAMRMGAADYLLKGSIEPSLLERSVRYAIEHKRAESALRESNRQLEHVTRRVQENQKQLVQSEKMASLGQLAAGVAHEINNPVGFVMSNLGTLGEYVRVFKEILDLYEQLATVAADPENNPAQELFVKIARLRKKEDLPYILTDIDQLLTESKEGTERVRDIVQSLKSFARLDEAKLKEADINEGIEATLKIVWNELKYRCEVHKKLGAIPVIRCYPGQLNQVFMNLLMNAVQAIPERGEITIETLATETDIIIRITDTGTGIQPESLSKLFDPFYTTKEVGQGTGLGLAISHGIIVKHNGTIEVESQVGVGTTFTIHLPVAGISQ